MAIVKYGAIITDLKGKIGGTVFQGSRVGSVAKNKPTSSNKSSSSKLTKADAGRLFMPQATVAFFAGQWRTLPDEDKATWSAQAINYPFLNKFGVPYTPSGYQLYMSLNVANAVIGGAIIYVCPEPTDLGEGPEFTIAWDGTDHPELDLGGPVHSGYVFQVYATVGMSAGRSPKKTDYKLIALLTDGSAMPQDLFDAYRAVFGSFNPGATVWFSGKLTKADAGRSTTNYTVSTVVPT